MVVEAARLVLFPALMAFAASSDLVSMTISNRLSILIAAGFAVLAVSTGMPLADALSHLGAGTLVLVIAFGFFALGWIGGGDAKLAAATALWFGFGHLFEYLAYAAILGGALTLVLLEFRKYCLPAFMTRQAWIERLHRIDSGIPYGIALAAAALLVYPSTAWMAGAG
ncbi:MAG: prepilin peptidase [Xanthobacteraceae bacterium]